MSDNKIRIPADGQKITLGADGRLQVPDRPILPFIEGDGTGPDITRAAMTAWNAAVEKAYGGKRKVEWMEIYAGEKANAVYGPNTWLPTETLDACRDYLVSIKGPLTTPVGGHPQPERRAAAGAGFVCLLAAGAVVRRRAESGEASGKNEHGDFPRERRRHLCGD